jgi:hypothetical protein
MLAAQRIDLRQRLRSDEMSRRACIAHKSKGGQGFGGIPLKISPPAFGKSGKRDCGKLHHPGAISGWKNGQEHLLQNRKAAQARS